MIGGNLPEEWIPNLKLVEGPDSEAQRMKIGEP